MVAFFVPSVSTPPSPSLAFQATTVQNSILTTYTYSSQSIGPITTDRLVIVAVHSLQSTPRTISSVTVDGISANLVPNTARSTTGFFAYRMGIYAAVVPTGTTATIVVTMSGSCDIGAISVWSAYGVSTTPVDGDSAVAASSPITLPSANTASMGVLVAAGLYLSTTPGTGSWAWTNATERSDIATVYIGTDVIASAADAYTTGAGVVVSATWSGSVDAGVAVVATFGPA